MRSRRGLRQRTRPRWLRSIGLRIFWSGDMPKATDTAGTPRSRLLFIAEHFDGYRRSGHGYMARCPAHDDNNPSLSISEGRDGRVLVHCHAGCDTRTILELVGLHM